MKKEQDIRRTKKKLTSLVDTTYESELIVLYMSMRLTDFTANIFQTLSVLKGKEKENKQMKKNQTKFQQLVE